MRQLTTRRFRAMALCAAALLQAAAAYAGSEHDVGRIKLLFQESDWTSREVAAEPIKIGSVSGTIAVKANVLTLREAGGRLVAVLHVSTSYGTGINIIIPGECPTPRGTYARPILEGQVDAPKCLMLGGPGNGPQIFDQIAPLKRDAADLAVSIPPRILFLKLSMWMTNGALIDVVGLLADDFAGLEGVEPKAVRPPQLSATAVAWADAMGEATYSALRSLSGKLEVPPMRFANSPR